MKTPTKHKSGRCRIKDVVCRVYRVKPHRLTSKLRGVKYAASARLAAYLLYYEYTDFSFPQIAQQFDRHHTTIMQGINSARVQLDKDPDFREMYETCEQEITLDGVRA